MARTTAASLATPALAAAGVAAIPVLGALSGTDVLVVAVWCVVLLFAIVVVRWVEQEFSWRAAIAAHAMLFVGYLWAVGDVVGDGAHPVRDVLISAAGIAAIGAIVFVSLRGRDRPVAWRARPRA